MSAATIAAALARAEQRLDRIDARALLGHVVGRNAAFLIAHRDDTIAPNLIVVFDALIARRVAGEPVAYLIGRREFFGREFQVTPDVLIPRPETERLVEVALERISHQGAVNVLDLGTGSGCIGITIALERPASTVTCVDRSRAALALAGANAAELGAANAEFVESDWYAALSGRRFDVIISNPPYIAAGDPHLDAGDLRFEPRDAVIAGEDGLAAVRAIAGAAPLHAGRDAWLLFEHGYDQAAIARDLLKRLGYGDVFSAKDLARIERVTGGRLRA